MKVLGRESVAPQLVLGAGDQSELILAQYGRRRPSAVVEAQLGIRRGPAVDVDRIQAGETGEQREVDETGAERSEVDDPGRVGEAGPFGLRHGDAAPVDLPQLGEGDAVVALDVGGVGFPGEGKAVDAPVQPRFEPAQTVALALGDPLLVVELVRPGGLTVLEGPGRRRLGQKPSVLRGAIRMRS